MSGFVLRGAPRVPPEVKAEREARALELLRAGMPRQAVSKLTRIYGQDMTHLCARHSVPHLPRVAGITPELRAEREAHALELLRAGLPSRVVAEQAMVSTHRIAELRAEHGIPCLATGRRQGVRNGPDVTRMSHAELDALEARVAADRASHAANARRP